MNGSSTIVKVVSLAIILPALTFGLYIIAHGHLTPGGGFQGGAIIASAFALFLVAFDKQASKTLRKNLLSALECLALLGFIGLSFFGLGKSFFFNFLANSGLIFGQAVPFGPNPGFINTAGVIPLMNFLVGLEVSCALTIIVLTMLKAGGDKK